MSKNILRSVNTHFWNDSFVEELTPSEKLLFLYLLTNPLTNILGVYEISLKRIAYDTGLNRETISKGLEGFERVRKGYYVNNFIILPNFLKNQNLNANMKKGAIDIFNALPMGLRATIMNIEENIIVKELEKTPLNYEIIRKGLKGFQRVRNSLLKYEREIEVEKEKEIESEVEGEKVNTPKKIDFESFWNLYDKKVGNKSKLIKKWDKLSLDDQKKIMEYIPNYKKAQPDKLYRKHPETFLNNRGWEDELIFGENKKQSSRPIFKTKINFDSDF